MGRFTVDTKMSEVFTAPEFAGYEKYVIYAPSMAQAVQEQNAAGAGEMSEEARQNEQMAMAPLKALATIGWSPEGIINGLNFYAEANSQGRTRIHFVYDESEIDDPLKRDVNLMQIIPEGELDRSKPAIVLSAGGAYNSVCTMVEAMPAARHFTEAGYQVFMLTYRVGCDMATPKAIDDLARAVKYLIDNKEELTIDPDNICFGGFSAGANLISNWGCTNIGYKKYGLPKPKAMFPVYTFIDLKSESKRDEKGGLVPMMFGPDYMDHIEEYNVVDHIDADYPPCYIVCGKDDTTVPCANSEMMKERLDAAGVPAVLNEGEHAQHGFGDGTGTDVEGWPERAMEFVASLQ